jgi:hypothetical protein
MKSLSIIAAICFALLAFESAVGQRIRVDFSASAFEPNASERELAPGVFISSGDTVTGTFDYEIPTIPLEQDGTFASYSPSAPASFSVTTNGITFETVEDFRIRITNNAADDGLSGRDSLTISDGFNQSTMAGPSGEHIGLNGQIIRGSTTLILHDESAATWDSIELPNRLDLNDFSATLGVVDGVNVEGNPFRFLYTIDSLNVQAVPEPNSLVSILAALFLLKRRRSIAA